MVILYLLAVYGMTNIIVNESVFRKQVDWLKSKSKFLNNLLSCPTCLGFWIGMGMFILIPLTITGIIWVDLLLSGIIASGAISIIEEIKTTFI